MTKRAVIRIDEKGKPFLEKGQMWLFRNNVKEVIGSPVDGDAVDIYCHDQYLATGFYSESSHIAVRILTHHKEEAIDRVFFQKRFALAWNYRKRTERNNLDNCRLIFGDGDGLGGLTVDRYNDVLVAQIISAGMEKRKDMLYETLLDVLQKDGQNVRYVYERNDVRAREKEGLSLYKGFWKEKGSTMQVIQENGLRLHVDIENGQKTGYFLDQKRNRMIVRQIAEGLRVCDCFTHTGGFALNAAMGKAAEVSAVDVSAEALKEAKANALLNHLDNISFVQADVFDYLDTLEEGQFDCIILDPPAFTKNRRTADHAYQGYLTINRKAMRVLRNGGYLATCSCSRYMENAMFEAMLKEASADEHAVLRQIVVSQQNADHPVVWTMDETSYLKFYVFQVLPQW